MFKYVKISSEHFLKLILDHKEIFVENCIKPDNFNNLKIDKEFMLFKEIKKPFKSEDY